MIFNSYVSLPEGITQGEYLVSIWLISPEGLFFFFLNVLTIVSIWLFDVISYIAMEAMAHNYRVAMIYGGIL